MPCIEAASLQGDEFVFINQTYQIGSDNNSLCWPMFMAYL